MPGGDGLRRDPGYFFLKLGLFYLIDFFLQICHLLQVVSELLLVDLSGHVVILVNVEQAHFQGYRRVCSIDRYFAGALVPQLIFAAVLLRSLQLRQVSLLRHNPRHAIDA